MHAWVVKTGRHTVLIDTCIGNDKERMARVHWHRKQTPFLEYEHWLKNPDPHPIRRAAFYDSAHPVVEAGRADLIEDGHEVDGALTVELAAGHTPGNVQIRLRSKA